VATFVAQLRRQERGRKPQTPTTAAGEALTPHTASMLLMRRPERCGEAEHAAIAQLREVHQDIGVAVSFTERFVEIVRERQGIKLSKWLSDAEASGIREIQQFAYTRLAGMKRRWRRAARFPGRTGRQKVRSRS
jgi:Transposase